MNRATTPYFQLISPEELRNGVLCHVEGWNSGCVFIYWETVNGVHHLRTPKTGKKYTTTNRLLWTHNRKCNAPQIVKDKKAKPQVSPNKSS